ncbi:hypothetical protein [Phenylobacterium sp.]|jgi:hypothetical protein|uniref:hypothetical protein n=1 Tax=Phenylobacterium sp. TaxID=1871053 RepID=UPI00378335C4
MTAVADYAIVYELEIRPRRRLKRALARVIWAGLYLVRPKLALDIWRERHGA